MNPNFIEGRAPIKFSLGSRNTNRMNERPNTATWSGLGLDDDLQVQVGSDSSMVPDLIDPSMSNLTLSYDKLMAKGDREAEQERWQEALRCWNRALTIRNDDPKLYEQVAQGYIALDDQITQGIKVNDEQLRQLTATIASATPDPKTKGESLESKENRQLREKIQEREQLVRQRRDVLQAAIKAATRSVELDSSFVWGHFTLGRALMLSGNPDLAVASMRRAYTIISNSNPPTSMLSGQRNVSNDDVATVTNELLRMESVLSRFRVDRDNEIGPNQQSRDEASKGRSVGLSARDPVVLIYPNADDDRRRLNKGNLTLDSSGDGQGSRTLGKGSVTDALAMLLGQQEEIERRDMDDQRRIEEEKEKLELEMGKVMNDEDRNLVGEFPYTQDKRQGRHRHLGRAQGMMGDDLEGREIGDNEQGSKAEMRKEGEELEDALMREDTLEQRQESIRGKRAWSELDDATEKTSSINDDKPK